MLENLKSKIPHHIAVILSSFSYILCAMSIGSIDATMIILLLLVFLTSIFYHSYPHNIYFRLADWIASLSIIFYLANFIYTHQMYQNEFVDILIFLSITSIISWIISLFAFTKNKALIFNISHTVWHFLGAIIIYFIIL